MTNPCCVWDFTIGENKIELQELKDILMKECKKWTFQLEKGDKTGYLHYQGRFSLKIKKRISELIKIFDNKNFHFSITSNSNKNNNFYVIKDDTRIGNCIYKDTDTNYYIPRQVREIKELRPFQKKIIELSQIWDTRKINIIFNEYGNKGKSILKTYMLVNGFGRFLPFCNDYQDIMRMVCNLPTSNCYLIDLPKGIKKDKLGNMYSAIETIKDGYAYDDRYHFKEKIFDSPNIFVFTNIMPNFDLLSPDRWNIFTINDDYELITYRLDYSSSSDED